jgi:hypothetical protein
VGTALLVERHGLGEPALPIGHLSVGRARAFAEPERTGE